MLSTLNISNTLAEMTDDPAKRFQKTPFALAGIPPAQPNRNAFAEQGMAEINHHLRGNAFAAQALNERPATPPAAAHPAMRGRSTSEASFLRRAATPTLRDVLELKDARHRAVAVDKDEHADEHGAAAAVVGRTATPGSSQTPSKKGVRELLTPITSWRPFGRMGSRKERLPPAGQLISPDSAAVDTEMPPTPPAKNTPPAITRSATTSGTIQVAYPLSQSAIAFDEDTSRIDEESAGFLPFFGGTHSRDHSPERASTAPNLALFATSNEEFELLSPDVYQPSAAPSPLRLNGQSVGTAQAAEEQVSPSTLLQSAPVLRHKTGSVQSIMPPRICSTIAEEPDAATAEGDAAGRSSSADEVSEVAHNASDTDDIDHNFVESLPWVDNIDKALSKVDQLASQVAKSLQNIYNKIEQLHIAARDMRDGKITRSELEETRTAMRDEMESQFDTVACMLEQMNMDAGNLDGKIKRVDGKIEKVDDKVDTNATIIRQELAGKIEEVNSNATTMRQELNSKMGKISEFTVLAVKNAFAHKVNEIQEEIQGKIDEYKKNADEHVEGIMGYFNEVSTALSSNNTAVNDLNSRIQAADAAASDGHAKIRDFQDKTNRLAKDMDAVHITLAMFSQRIGGGAQGSRTGNDRDFQRMKQDLDHIKTALQVLKYELDEGRQCRYAVATMYTRVAAMTHMWDNFSNSDILDPAPEPTPTRRRQGGTAARAAQSSAAAAAASTPTKAAKTGAKGKAPQTSAADSDTPTQAPKSSATAKTAAASSSKSATVTDESPSTTKSTLPPWLRTSKSFLRSSDTESTDFLIDNAPIEEPTGPPRVPQFFTTESRVVPATPTAFLDMIFALQDRLDAVEEAQRVEAARRSEATQGIEAAQRAEAAQRVVATSGAAVTSDSTRKTKVKTAKK